MIVVALADIHSRTDNLPRLAAVLAASDLVVLAGDITHFGRAEEAEAVVSAVSRYQPQVLAVAGNCDHREVASYLEQEGISLHRRHQIREGIAFLGVGMSLPAPGRTPGEIGEEDFARFLDEAAAGIPDNTPLVLVVHEPPFGSRVDYAFTGRHVGSQAIRQFIESRQPLLCLTGHIHEGRGEDRIGDTLVLNPGPLPHGGYAWAEVTPTGCRGEIRSL